MSASSEKVCLVCDGAVIVRPRKASKFCSATCYNRHRLGDKRETRQCLHCEAKIVTLASQNKQYCSRACKGAAKRNKKTRACLRCGTEFSYFRTQANRQYCTLACYTAERQDQTKCERQCPFCKIVFMTSAATPKTYCSRLCAGRARDLDVTHLSPSAYVMTCRMCEVDFVTEPRKRRSGFCSQACWGRWRSIYQRGEAHWRFGKKFPRHPRYRPHPEPITKTCPQCQEGFIARGLYPERRVACSRACWARYIASTHCGPEHPNWRGGTDNYRGPNWEEQRAKTRERDEVCQNCGVSPEELGRALSVHHIIRFGDFGIERYLEANDLSNLICFCQFCHQKLEWSGESNPRSRNKRVSSL